MGAAEKIPGSAPVKVPGGTPKMQLTETRIRATGTNVSGYALYRVSCEADDPGGLPDRRLPHPVQGEKPRSGTEITRS